MQSNLAPSVTPRPVKHHAGSSSALVASGSRAGRTYTPSVSPIKSPRAGANPFEPTKAHDGGRPPETVTSGASSPMRLRKKPLVVSGDIRNLDSNFDIAMSKVRATLPEVIAVFRKYDIVVANDEAQTLLHEYEENNDRGQGYEPFVEDLVQVLRQTAMNKRGSTRLTTKKMRLAEHCRLLGTMHSLLVDELQALLRDKLRVSWSNVRDAFRGVDTRKTGRLSKADFARICDGLGVPVSPALIDALVVRFDADSDGEVDYNEFLTHFGSAFQHGDTNSVGFSLIHGRPLGGLVENSASTPATPASSMESTHSHVSVNHTLQSPGVTHALNSKSPKKTKQNIGHGAGGSGSGSDTGFGQLAADPAYMEKLRIILNEKISSRHSDVKKAFMALDQDGNGFISAVEFDQVLRNFNLIVTKEESDALLAYFDTNRDGCIDYHEFFAKFGDVMKPSAVAMMKKQQLLENSSLVFGGERDIKGANKNRMALSSPGSELKDAFSRLSDEIWRDIYVELEMSDIKKTGVVPSAELLRVLCKYLGDLPKQQFAVLFRACGSHVNQLMNYRQLVKSYRHSVMDPVEYFQQDTHSQTERTYRKSPTESLVMVWSVRVQRAQMPALEWTALKDDLWRADARRVGRVLASQFGPIVKRRMQLTDDQAAFLCFFYEDKNLTADQVTIRYGSFLTDYEDSGLEEGDAASTTSTTSGGAGTNAKHKQRTEGKGRVRQPGYGIHNSHHHASNSSGPGTESLADEDDKRLRQFFAVNIRSLDALLADADPEKRGFIGLEQFMDVCKDLSGGKWKENVRAFTTLVGKYVAQNNFYYRGFLLDFDTRSGLQTQALIVQDDDSVEGDDTANGDGSSENNAEGDQEAVSMDIHEAKDALRHHLTVSLPRQKVVYKLFQRMDPGKSGVMAYPELRRVLERLDIVLDDAVARELCGGFEEEDESTGNRTGRVKYLMLLHALGGRDPDKLDGMSDISSNCSYYSAISISPRAVSRSPAQTPRSVSSRDHAVAARAVSNAIDKPRQSSLSGAAAAAAVERKIKTQLEALGRTKWKQLARAFQQVDSERRGSVSASSFRKVLEDVGVLLDQEEVLRLQLKYDVEQNGRLHYHEYLRHLTNAMSELPVIDEGSGSGSGAMTLPALGTTSPAASPRVKKGGPGVTQGMPVALRQGVKAKWKAIYASFKTLDKQNVGRVSSAHFRQLLEWYALSVADDTFLQLLRLYDHDEDGGVDYNKFMRACFA